MVSLVATGSLVAACALNSSDVTSGPSGGGSGALGNTCQCANSAKECTGITSGCNSGLVCTTTPNGSRQVCAQACPCPVSFVCKVAGFVGGALLCFKD